MTGYWVPVLLGAFGVVALLALAVVTGAHLRRLLQVVARARRTTAAEVAPVQAAAALLGDRFGRRRTGA